MSPTTPTTPMIPMTPLSPSMVSPMGRNAVTSSSMSIASTEGSTRAESVHQVEEQDITAEIDKKEALRNGVKKMLEVTTNNDARSMLTGQLSIITKDLQDLQGSLDNLASPVFISLMRLILF
jgi:hypothetical protein